MSIGKSFFVGVFVWALAPLCVWFAFFCFDVWFVVICLHTWTVWVLVQMSFLTAYAHVRTEPQCDIGHTRKKKRCLPDVRAAAFKLEAGKIEFSAFSVGELAELKKQWARLMHWL